MTFSYNFDNENIKKKHRSHVRFNLLDIILAQWQGSVASSKALGLLHWAMCAVTYRRIAMAIKTASFVGIFVDCCLFACCPGSPGAIRSKQLPNGGIQWLLEQPWTCCIGRCTLYCTSGLPWPSKWPTTVKHVDTIVNFVINNNRSQRPCYGPSKLKLKHCPRPIGPIYIVGPCTLEKKEKKKYGFLIIEKFCNLVVQKRSIAEYVLRL